MSVKRYYWDRKSDCDCEIVEQPDGAMVDYDEHASVVAALESRCTAKDEKLRMINELIDAAEQVNKLAQEATERLIQERNALAAENAGLNKFIKDDCFIYTSDDSEPRDAYDFKPETPGTESFLAEVRASAVDEVCLKISNAIINCYQDEQVGLDAAATICGDFAAQLRKGVQS